MDFAEKISQLSAQIAETKGKIKNEAGTKMSLIVPLFTILGYDIHNPEEFCPEYTADVGTKKHEKVDYAILDNGVPIILIECKKCSEPLTKSIDEKTSQLYRYFATTTAKFGILTNGLKYQFYTDLEAANIMDLTPFMEIDIEGLTDASIGELKKFQKESFNPTQLFATAERLKYLSSIRIMFEEECACPSVDFVHFVLDKIDYKGHKTQNVIEKFTPVVQKAFSSFVNKTVNDRIKAALIDNETDDASENASKIVTTEDEIKAFYIVRGLLCEIVSIEDIVYRDAQTYFSILYTNNNRKPICRIQLDNKHKWIYIPKADSGSGSKKFEKLPLRSLSDLYKFKSKFIGAVKQYL